MDKVRYIETEETWVGGGAYFVH